MFTNNQITECTFIALRAEAKMIKATTNELKSSHVPIWSQPDKVAAAIIKAVRDLYPLTSVAAIPKTI